MREREIRSSVSDGRPILMIWLKEFLLNLPNIDTFTLPSSIVSLLQEFSNGEKKAALVREMHSKARANIDMLTV